MLDSLRARLLAAFLLPTLALLTGAGFLGYRASRNVLEEELGASLSGVAAAVASQVSVERLLALTPEDAEGEGSRTFRTLSRQLNEARTATHARRIVAFTADGRVLLDSGGTLPIGAELPELARDRLELSRVLEAKERSHSQVLFEGNDGQLYKTGYAPLVSADKIVGAIAVEGSAEFFGPLRRLFRAYVALLAATLLVLALAAVLTARALARPLERLVQSALRIGKGDLSTKVEAQPTTREIGILSHELEAMRGALESRDRQLKMMLGGVAHEVKNPLGGIELFAGLLAEDLGGHPAHDHVKKIQRELDYLKRIVEDFLTFAREQKLNSLSFQPGDWVSAARDVLAGEAQGKGVLLEATAEAAPLEGDVSLLTSALVNLVKNAVQVSKSGQTVKLVGRRDGGRYVVEVHDEGPGIPVDALPRIFEPFYTTREKGTGLGLPLARKLFEAHKGTLDVDSKPGRTVFRAELPVASV
jgi:signal transduction histidine kinase